MSQKSPHHLLLHPLYYPTLPVNHPLSSNTINTSSFIPNPQRFPPTVVFLTSSLLTTSSILPPMVALLIMMSSRLGIVFSDAALRLLTGKFSHRYTENIANSAKPGHKSTAWSSFPREYGNVNKEAMKTLDVLPAVITLKTTIISFDAHADQSSTKKCKKHSMFLNKA